MSKKLIKVDVQEMLPLGLDIGTSAVKAVKKRKRIIFPSIYCKRRVKSVWDEKGKEEGEHVIEAVAEDAIQLSKHEDTILIRPIMEGQIRHDVAVKLVQEAFKRIEISQSESVMMVTGLPYDVSVHDINRLEKVLTTNANQIQEVAIYPQSFGSLIDVNLESATIINIGHSTTGLLLVENLTVLGGGTEPKATDYVVDQVRSYIIRNHGILPRAEMVRDLVVSKEVKVNDTIIINKVDTLVRGKTVITRKDIDLAMKSAVDFLCERIAYDIVQMHSQLPTANLGCMQNIILSGAFSKLQDPYTKKLLLKEGMEKKLDMPVTMPNDPMFSEANGYYKLAKELSV